jgi:pyruvate kinase
MLTTVRKLRQSTAAEAAKRIETWLPDIEQASFTAGAINLAHYLAFRHDDPRELQRDLMRHGLSSPGRLASRVEISLRTVESVLEAAVAGKSAASSPPSAQEFSW